MRRLEKSIQKYRKKIYLPYPNITGGWSAPRYGILSLVTKPEELRKLQMVNYIMMYLKFI